MTAPQVHINEALTLSGRDHMQVRKEKSMPTPVPFFLGYSMGLSARRSVSGVSFDISFYDMNTRNETENKTFTFQIKPTIKYSSSEFTPIYSLPDSYPQAEGCGLGFPLMHCGIPVLWRMWRRMSKEKTNPPFPPHTSLDTSAWYSSWAGHI